MTRSNDGKPPGYKPEDRRFRVPVQRSRHAVTTRIALTLALCLATLTIVVVASGMRMTDADASGANDTMQMRD